MKIANTAVAPRIENVVLALAFLFGQEKRLISLTQQLVGPHDFCLRKECNTGAGRYLKEQVSQLHGIGRRLLNSMEDLPATFSIGDIRQNDSEVISAQSGECVTPTQGCLHALGDGVQQFVANVVPIAIIYRREVVQIDKCNCHWPLGEVRIGHSLMQTGGKVGPVRQSGQRIVEGNMLKLALLFFRSEEHTSE